MSKSLHAFTDDSLARFDACQLAKLLQKGEITSYELISDCIRRAQVVEPELRAIVTDDFDRGLLESKQTKEGFFAGIPMFFKDLTGVKGLPFYFGTEALRHAQPSLVNDPIAEQIFSMGFINLGMTSMPEFGMTCSTEFPEKPPTANPWNLDFSVGGSSGGAAALVAAGVLPMAHGADGGGSIRIPAACCGLVGLKPSRGRLLLSGAFQKQLVEISTDGVISRSVRDTAQFFIEAETYYRNKNLPPIGRTIEPNTKTLTIGYSQDPANGSPVDSATKTTLESTVATLTELGHVLKPVANPASAQMIDDLRGLWAFNGFLLNRFGKQLFGKHYEPQLLTKFMKGLSKYYNRYIFKTPGLIKRLKQSYRSYQSFLDTTKIDMWLTPTLGHLTPKHGYLGMDLEFEEIFTRMGEWACFSAYANLVGCPSISLPLGHDEINNLPIGMMFCGGLGQDKGLLELAYQIEEARPWAKIYKEKNTADK